MPYIGNPIYQSAFVTDSFSGTGSQTAYTMSVAPAGTTNVLVVVSGVVQDPSTYGVVGNTLTFSTAPPSGTGNISCRYLGVPATGVTTTAYRTVTEFTATAGQTTFTPPSYNVGFINVYLNGVLLGSADYTATNGTTVVLTTGASAGNLVTVESFSISSVANAISNSAGAINLAGTLISGVLPVANGGTGVTTSTGSGANVLGTSPTLITPALGTPSAINLSNATALPSAALPSGTILQVVQGSSSTQVNTNTTAWITTNVSATITPRSSTSKVFAMCSGNWNTQTNTLGPSGVSIFRNGTNLSSSAYGLNWIYTTTGGDTHFPLTVSIVDSPATTSAVTYDVRVNANGGGSGNVRWNYASTPIYIILMEVAA